MITIELKGRLGNQMFQYSIARLIAENNGYNFYLTKEKNQNKQNISDYFNLDMGNADGLIRNIYIENGDQIYDPNLFNISDFTSLSGFFQTEKYFLDHQEKIKDWFKIKKTNEVQEILNKYPIDEYCYIHFRGGDYKDMHNWSLPKKYYDDAMKKISGNLKFLIITDDIKLASEFFPNIAIMSNDMMVDFALLYYSKFCIISNSSFSWWAAYLGRMKNKDLQIVLPKKYSNLNEDSPKEYLNIDGAVFL
jgi:hypothetical protein